MKTILEHKNTGVRFEFVNEYKPQFSGVVFVNLKNLKSGRVESFVKSTYLYFFTIVKRY